MSNNNFASFSFDITEPWTIAYDNTTITENYYCNNNNDSSDEADSGDVDDVDGNVNINNGSLKDDDDDDNSLQAVETLIMMNNNFNNINNINNNNNDDNAVVAVNQKNNNSRYDNNNANSTKKVKNKLKKRTACNNNNKNKNRKRDNNNDNDNNTTTKPKKKPRIGTVDWETRYQQLKAHYEETGNCDIHIKDPKWPGLYKWASKQRTYCRRYEEGTPEPHMNLEKFAKLQAINFDFTIGQELSSWDDHYEKLKQYKAQHGHVHVAKSDSKNKRLYQWIIAQRKECKNYQKQQKCKISEGRIAKLEAIDFDFESPNFTPVDWDTRYQELLQYRKAYGHVDLPRYRRDASSVNGANNPKYKSLSYWVERQRCLYRKLQKGEKSNPLTQERIDKLKKIGFDFFPVWASTFNGYTTPQKAAEAAAASASAAQKSKENEKQKESNSNKDTTSTIAGTQQLSNHDTNNNTAETT